jgi:hypothetical protein
MDGPRIAVTIGGVVLIAFILGFFFGRRSRGGAWPARRDGHITPSTSPPPSRDSG